MGGYRSGPAGTVAGEEGYYDAVITAYNTLDEDSEFETFEDYILDMLESDNNDVVYDRSEEKNNEASEPVALGVRLSRQADETSSENRITDTDEKVKTTIRKEEQWETIQKANPMRDDIHTGIRSADEILTFEEALEADGISDGDEGMAPDVTAGIIERAKETGEIAVYSSKPIAVGGFVTPSAMEARANAGNGPIYSQTVSTGDVAWIDSLQGQYAPVTRKTESPRGRASVEVPGADPNQERRDAARKSFDAAVKDLQAEGSYGNYDYWQAENKYFSELAKISGKGDNLLQELVEAEEQYHQANEGNNTEYDYSGELDWINALRERIAGQLGAAETASQNTNTAGNGTNAAESAHNTGGNAQSQTKVPAEQSERRGYAYYAERHRLSERLAEQVDTLEDRSKRAILRRVRSTGRAVRRTRIQKQRRCQ